MSNDVFISYSHDDKEWLDRLQKTLKPLLRKKTISTWDDTKIRVGAKWKDNIEKALSEAKAAVLLVSQNFLASDFIASEEVPELLESARTKGLKIIWVPISDCMWRETEIANYQAAYSPESPLDSLEKWQVNKALVQICNEIKEALRPPPPPDSLPDTEKEDDSQNWPPPPPPPPPRPPRPPPLMAQFAGTWRNPDGSYIVIRQNGTMVAAESFVNIFGIHTKTAWGQGTIAGRQAFFDFMDMYGNAGKSEATLSDDNRSIIGVARYNNGMSQNIFASRVG